MTPRFLDGLPRFVFFTGKGGVGKTSLACATAVHLAGQGRKILLVSTDPASNVGQVFEQSVGNSVTEIHGVPNLFALEIDPEAAADAFRERVIGPVRGIVPEAEIASLTEQLSGSCTTEIASFNEFTGLLASTDETAGFDHIVFDTAPTGHTIRLLQLPGSWTGFLDAGQGDASCLGPMAGLDRQHQVYRAAVEALGDAHRTRMVLVTRPQRSSLAESARTAEELQAIGIASQFLVINGALPDEADADPLAGAVREREERALAGMPSVLARLASDSIALKPWNIVGLRALETLFDDFPSPGETTEDLPALPVGVSLAALLDEIEHDGHGLILCMGKGGVGKTTLAAALAVGLARRGHKVHLTTTDPAAHLGQTLAGEVEGLRVSRIDPVEATRAYRDRVMATRGKGLDEAGRASLREDLMSPCTEEVAVFSEFSRVIRESRRDFVVVDTAPTGHTLLLLDAAGSYHREMTRQIGDKLHFRTPLTQLQDSSQTKVLLVTLAETTPVLEALELQSDLQRAGIRPWAWVVNGSLLAAQPTSPFLRRRAQTEYEHIRRVEREAERLAVIPMLVDEPVGADRLAALTRRAGSPREVLRPAP